MKKRELETERIRGRERKVTSLVSNSATGAASSILLSTLFRINSTIVCWLSFSIVTNERKERNLIQNQRYNNNNHDDKII